MLHHVLSHEMHCVYTENKIPEIPEMIPDDGFADMFMAEYEKLTAPKVQKGQKRKRPKTTPHDKLCGLVNDAKGNWKDVTHCTSSTAYMLLVALAILREMWINLDRTGNEAAKMKVRDIDFEDVCCDSVAQQAAVALFPDDYAKGSKGKKSSVSIWFYQGINRKNTVGMVGDRKVINGGGRKFRWIEDGTLAFRASALVPKDDEARKAVRTVFVAKIVELNQWREASNGKK